MKRTLSLLCVALCTLVLATSCRHEVTPDMLSGTYRGTIDVELNISNLSEAKWTISDRQVVVTEVDASHVDIALLDLNLEELIGIELPGQDFNFGTITARCLVGSTNDGEAPLSGTATVAGQSVAVHGEYDEGVLDIIIPLGVVTIEFEGVK